jgi:hypothetical protein
MEGTRKSARRNLHARCSFQFPQRGFFGYSDEDSAAEIFPMGIPVPSDTSRCVKRRYRRTRAYWTYGFRIQASGTRLKVVCMYRRDSRNGTKLNQKAVVGCSQG